MILREQFPVTGWALTPKLRSILAMQVRVTGRVEADITFSNGGLVHVLETLGFLTDFNDQ